MIFNSLVKQASWAVEKFPSFEDNNKSDDEDVESSDGQGKPKEFRRRVDKLEVIGKETKIEIQREAGFLSVEKLCDKNFALVWRTLAGQNPYSIEINARASNPQEIKQSEEESKILINGKDGSSFSQVVISFSDP